MFKYDKIRFKEEKKLFVADNSSKVAKKSKKNISKTTTRRSGRTLRNVNVISASNEKNKLKTSVSDHINIEKSDSEDEVSDLCKTGVSNNSIADVVLTQDMDSIKESDTKLHQDSCHLLYLSKKHRISD